MFLKSAYLASTAKAKSIGYKECPDPRAYLGISYIKKGKKWIIFSPEHLLEDKAIKAMNVKNEDDLERIGYNVRDYYDYHPEWLAHIAEINRLEAERICLETERMCRIGEILGNAMIDRDEVDNINETLSQVGYDPSTLQRYKNEDYDEDDIELSLEDKEQLDEDELTNTDLDYKILVWHCNEEKKKMPHIYKKRNAI